MGRVNEGPVVYGQKVRVVLELALEIVGGTKDVRPSIPGHSNVHETPFGCGIDEFGFVDSKAPAIVFSDFDGGFLGRKAILYNIDHL